MAIHQTWVPSRETNHGRGSTEGLQ
jgi:hypothetical protein